MKTNLNKIWAVMVEIRAPLVMIIFYGLVTAFAFYLAAKQGIHLK